jgi:hypothetical protein
MLRLDRIAADISPIRVFSRTIGFRFLSSKTWTLAIAMAAGHAIGDKDGWHPPAS